MTLYIHNRHHQPLHNPPHYAIYLEVVFFSCSLLKYLMYLRIAEGLRAGDVLTSSTSNSSSAVLMMSTAPKSNLKALIALLVNLASDLPNGSSTHPDLMI